VLVEEGYSCHCDIEFQGPNCQYETPCNGHGKRCYNDGICKRQSASEKHLLFGWESDNDNGK